MKESVAGAPRRSPLLLEGLWKHFSPAGRKQAAPNAQQPCCGLEETSPGRSQHADQQSRELKQNKSLISILNGWIKQA